ncbi:MAG TPA: hypothetical protein VHG72_13965 [Polyangia bacterium]|nr:hypothetical protein [Polyangia bacterium]
MARDSPPESYVCAACHETFEKDWPEGEARSEAAENFPGMDVDTDAGIVCDDCYRKLMWLPARSEQS